jgi:hypothetical protein
MAKWKRDLVPEQIEATLPTPSHANLLSLPSDPDAQILLLNLLGEAGGVRATTEKKRAFAGNPALQF